MYRIFSACGAIGYGFPEASLEKAMEDKLDLIACDAGSIDPGPYYLGNGTSYMSYESVKRDFKLLLEAAVKQGCPLVIGNCGMAGDTSSLAWMVDIAKECFKELALSGINVATIDSHIKPEGVIDNIDYLTPVGNMPVPDKSVIKKSAIVAQAGIDPFITALKEGARVILAGRACDVAIFAGPAIYHGVEAGLAFHAGHILECGAVACLPGSASDSLVAEIEGDKVRLIAPANNRVTTITSIAAHGLYEESSPVVQEYPEGKLLLNESIYYQQTEEIAAFSNSRFIHKPLTIKLEGAYSKGYRCVSLLPVEQDKLNNLPESLIIYGRNGVDKCPIKAGEQELGIN